MLGGDHKLTVADAAPCRRCTRFEYREYDVTELNPYISSTLFGYVNHYQHANTDHNGGLRLPSMLPWRFNHSCKLHTCGEESYIPLVVAC